MLVLSLITLAIALIATCLSINIEEDVFKAAMVCTALLFLCLTLILAPWVLKLAIIAIPIGLERLNKWPAGKASN